jgi:hypothetical protein
VFCKPNSKSASQLCANIELSKTHQERVCSATVYRAQLKSGQHVNATLAIPAFRDDPIRASRKLLDSITAQCQRVSAPLGILGE